jgi:hypothetical protein
MLMSIEQAAGRVTVVTAVVAAVDMRWRIGLAVELQAAIGVTLAEKPNAVQPE